MTQITSSIPEGWHHLFLDMNRPAESELLYRLQAQLEHFDRSPDFGDAEVVADIRRHLLTRIREAEGSVRCCPVPQVQRVSRAEAA